MSRTDCRPFKSERARERYLAFYDGEAARLWPADHESRTLVTEDGETFVRVGGPPDAPPLVLLPGSRANSLCWAAMIPELSRNFRTYALDAAYDVGRSVSSRPIDSASDVTRWLDGVLDCLGLERVNLMGLSLGGWAAAEYALRRPNRLTRVVWLAPAGVVLPISVGFIARSLPCLIPTRATLGGFLCWIMPDASSSTGPVREYCDRALEDLLLSAASFAPRPMPGGTPRVLTDAELTSIEVPVLYVVGEHERVCSGARPALSRLEACAPEIETLLVDDAGHDLFWVKAAEVARRVTQFLDACGAPSNNGIEPTARAPYDAILASRKNA
jgi:pimeloyl-ACP methyl ester carboxylesterase